MSDRNGGSRLPTTLNAAALARRSAVVTGHRQERDFIHAGNAVTTPTCTHCGTVREILKQNGVAYEERDIAADVGAMQELVDKTRQTAVPVVEIDGMTAVGADRRQIESLLEAEGLLTVSQA